MCSVETLPAKPELLAPACSLNLACCRLQFSNLHDEFWQHLESLPVDEPLPADLPSCFYFHLHSYLQSGRYADRLAPWIRAFGRDRCVAAAPNVCVIEHSLCCGVQPSPNRVVAAVLQPALRFDPLIPVAPQAAAGGFQGLLC